MVMRQMRDNTKWIMIATGVAFVALMVFSWGMDITGRNSGQAGTDIGSVNGVKVATPAFTSLSSSMYRFTASF